MDVQMDSRTKLQNYQSTKLEMPTLTDTNTFTKAILILITIIVLLFRPQRYPYQYLVSQAKNTIIFSIIEYWYFPPTGLKQILELLTGAQLY